jgi:von Willebrand factor type A C-terminal domain/von Willebrand factor type A domain
MSEPGFTVAVFQNEYLPEGGQEVHAIVTVTSPETGSPAAQGGTNAAEVIIIDCSGSMGGKSTKIEHARKATCAAIDVIRDGVEFAVIKGTHEALPVYPTDGTLVTASAQTKDLAKRAVADLHASGGTAIGQWLSLARQILLQSSAPIRHAILLTDGNDELESVSELETAIAGCEGVFSCDCRGVGTDWQVAELRRISAALLGTVDIVPEPEGLTADFEAMMGKAMAKHVADIMLRIWTPQQAVLKSVKQVSPTIDDLTERRSQSDPLVGEYPTGAWGDAESREYHICVQLSPDAVGHEVLAARVSVLADSTIVGQGLVRATWTDDLDLSSKINVHVKHYVQQADLAQNAQDGVAALQSGDEDTATDRFGRAVALAHQSGNEPMLGLLSNVVDVIDPGTGTVKVKKKVTAEAAMMLDARSVITKPPEEVVGSGRNKMTTCPVGHNSAAADFCDVCGRPVGQTG